METPKQIQAFCGIDTEITLYLFQGADHTTFVQHGSNKIYYTLFEISEGMDICDVYFYDFTELSEVVDCLEAFEEVLAYNPAEAPNLIHLNPILW